MSCATHPQLCREAEYLLKAPMAAPPESGWKIIKLPYQAWHLQGVWMTVPGNPQSSKAAWAQLLSFLKANKISVPFDQIKEESIEQWCAPNPKRCRGYRTKAWRRAKGQLAWAPARWEWANGLLVNPEDPGKALEEIVIDLTARIQGPDGCVLCAGHWAEVLAKHPIPLNPTLEQARHWLVDRHNDTREGLLPTAYAEVASKFKWV